MGGGRKPRGAHHLYLGRGPGERAAPHLKLVALVTFVMAVAVTPRHAVAAFGVHALVVAAVAGAARVPAGVILRRLVVVAPFLALAATVPFLGDGPRAAVGPLELSTDGLWAGWNIAAKTLLGATASIVLTATTPIGEVLTGLTRLRVPRPVVAIVGLMIRYLDLIAEQLGRMRRAMTARGHDPRWLWQARPIATAAGTLFVRTYERGERIHHAMLARGFTGHMPEPDRRPARAVDALMVLTPSAVAVATATTAMVR